MKLKKLLSIAIASVFSIPSLSFTAFANANQGLTESEIENASVKPKLTASKITMTLDEAMSNNVVTLAISVDGADGEYCSTGIHVYYDDRLSLAENSRGRYQIRNAQDFLSGTYKTDDKSAAACPPHSGSTLNSSKTAGMKGIFLSTSGSGNDGFDGDIWTFDVELPNYAEPGDVFPIDILYKSNAYAEDMFLDINREKIDMQAYVFTKGIYNEENLNFVDEPIYGTSYDGYIYIKPEIITTTTTTATTTTTTTTTTTANSAEHDEGLIIDKKEITLKENEQYTITANRSDLTFKSSNTDVAIVSKSGVITAWGKGNAVISIVDTDGNFAQIKVTVAENTAVKETALNLMENEQYRISADGSDISYKSSNTGVAIVSKSGVITAWGKGTAVITVMSGNDVLEIINVTVTPEETGTYKAGDANGDSNITISDAVAILQSLANAEKYPLSEQGKLNADVDGVPGVTGKDAAVIQQYDAGAITSLPIK